MSRSYFGLRNCNMDAWYHHPMYDMYWKNYSRIQNRSSCPRCQYAMFALSNNLSTYRQNPTIFDAAPSQQLVRNTRYISRRRCCGCVSEPSTDLFTDEDKSTICSGSVHFNGARSQQFVKNACCPCHRRRRRHQRSSESMTGLSTDEDTSTLSSGSGDSDGTRSLRLKNACCSCRSRSRRYSSFESTTDLSTDEGNSTISSGSMNHHGTRSQRLKNACYPCRNCSHHDSSESITDLSSGKGKRASFKEEVLDLTENTEDSDSDIDPDYLEFYMESQRFKKERDLKKREIEFVELSYETEPAYANKK